MPTQVYAASELNSWEIVGSAVTIIVTSRAATKTVAMREAIIAVVWKSVRFGWDMVVISRFDSDGGAVMEDVVRKAGEVTVLTCWGFG